jgi:outer membrane protein TolC
VSLFANASAAAVSPGADPRSGAVGVTVTIPVFLGYQTTYRVLSARENAERTSAVRERLRNDISLEVWRAFQDMRSQAQALLTANDLVTSATESYEVALGRYRAGVGTVIDLLTAQTALVQAGFQKIQARLRWNVSRVALARAIGALEPALFSDTAPAGPTPRAPR